MDMKHLEISKLMDEYQDHEFFPEGEPAGGVEAVKARVLARTKAPAGKGRLSGRKKLFLVAGLAAALVLMGAGLPYLQHRLVSGELFFQQTANGRITGLVHYGPSLLEEEDGRLFFNQDDGQRLDITDLISEEMPYIFDGSDLDSGKVYYIIAGGTPECYGYLEWIIVPNPFSHGDDPQPSPVFDESGRETTTAYAFTSVSNESGEDHYGNLDSTDSCVYLEDGMHHPWLLAGMTQLGIPYVDSESGTDEIFYAP